MKSDHPATTLAEHLRDGDSIFIAQAAGEPFKLVDALIENGARFRHLQVFCGYSLNTAWNGELPATLDISTYCGLGAMGALVANARAKVIPFSMSQLSGLLGSGKMHADVVLLQVSPADADGYHSLGCSLDYVWEAAQGARAVIVEVNARVPRTRGSRRLHCSMVIVGFESDSPLPELSAEPIGQVQQRIAQHVATLVPDGATLQLGIGKLADAVAAELTGRRGMRVRSGMVGDWFLGLAASGAVARSDPVACAASLAVGSAALYDSLSAQDMLSFALPAELVIPLEGSPFMAINSAIEVDLRGQANAEFLGERYVGASSGQPDYFRAARKSKGGLAILAIPSTNERGDKSRIVSRIGSGYVTSTQSDIDVVVTEHGIADIRGTNFDQRRSMLADIAAPEFRRSLLTQAP